MGGQVPDWPSDIILRAKMATTGSGVWDVIVATKMPCCDEIIQHRMNRSTDRRKSIDMCREYIAGRAQRHVNRGHK